jgi:carbon monoxide dehydrogenase subunit G
MPDYERNVDVAVSPEAAFSFLSDPHNIPRYVATVVEAEPRGDGTLRIAAEVEGRHEEGDARLDVDSAGRRIEWSGPGDSGYHGSLQVSAVAEGSSVTLRIHVETEQHEDELNRVLDATAANIERLLQGE